ncbi:MAG: hypothetical protein QM765_47540 [Myxococcales bacterium]
MLTTRVVDLSDVARQSGSPPAVPVSSVPAPAATPATPVTPWPVVYVPAGTGADGRQMLMAVPYGALTSPAQLAALPPAPVDAPTRVVPIQPLPDLEPAAVRAVQEGELDGE